MEQFISEIEAFCEANGIAPQRLLREAVNAQWGLWQKWKDGDASPTLRVVDKIRGHMASMPPSKTEAA